MKEQEELTIKLSVGETNQVLEALGNQPFNRVFQIINKIQQQAATQLNSEPTKA